MSNQITPNPSAPSQVVAEVTFPRWINNLGIIPTSYKDSMSYYECLAWLCKFLEETVIPTVNQNGEAVQELQNLYIELNAFVTHYFDNLDVQEEINNKLDSMVQSGELQTLLREQYNELETEVNAEINTFKINLTNTLAQETLERKNADNSLSLRISNLASGSPIPVSSTSQMTDTSKIYLNTTDGYWYYYNGTQWTQGGVYQASQISSDNEELDGRNVKSSHLPFQYGAEKFVAFENFVQGGVIGVVNQEPTYNQQPTRIRNDENNEFSSGTYKLINLNPSTYSYSYCFMDSDHIVTTGSTWITDEISSITVPANCTMALNIRKNDNSNISLSEGLSNIRLFNGSNFIYSIPNIYSSEPIAFDSFNRRITIPAGTVIENYSQKITLDTASTINYAGGSVMKVILLNRLTNNISVQNLSSSINSNMLIIGYFFHRENRIIFVKINGIYTINGLDTPNRNYFINNNLLCRVDNINPSANGINLASQSSARVSNMDYINYNGKLIVYNKQNTVFSFGIQGFSLSDNVYTRVSDTGWRSDYKFEISLNPNYYYVIVFRKSDNSNITIKEALDNFILQNIIGETSDENISIIKPKISNFLSVGHQGNGAGTTGTRGNSKTGFINGALHGFDELECDVRFTLDNVIVLNHDDTITDDSNDTYVISETSYETLSAKLFNGEKICTLDEYLEICKRYGTRARIDHLAEIWTNSTAVNSVINSIKKYQMNRNVTFTINRSVWSQLLADFPFARYIEVYSSYNSNTLDQTNLNGLITIQNNNPNAQIGIALNYVNYNIDETFTAISNNSRLLFEFFTIDNASSYNSLMPYVNSITSNTLTAYDALIEFRS